MAPGQDSADAFMGQLEAERSMKDTRQGSTRQSARIHAAFLTGEQDYEVLPATEAAHDPLVLATWLEEVAREVRHTAHKITDVRVDPDKAAEPLLKFFAFGHLPDRLQIASRPFCEVAEEVVRTWPRSAERTVCLRKLLEAKDASVRCWL